MEQGKGKIYASISGVIEDIGYVGKDKINKDQGFKYRSIDDVFNALHPALAKNRVFIVPTILDRTCDVVYKTKTGKDMVKVVCKIRFDFFAEDGSSVSAIIVGEGMDMGDKATNKAMAIAYKYACFQVFCIPTEDLMTDPDSASPGLGKEDEQSISKETGIKKGKTGTKKETSGQSEEDPGESSGGNMITAAMIKTIKAEQQRTGVTDQQIFAMRAIKAKKIEDMTVEEFRAVMSKFEKTPDLLKGEDKHE